MVQRKILLIGRHGKAPQKPEGGSVDELVPGAVKEIYDAVGVPLQAEVAEMETSSARAFLERSNKIRTEYTGQAVLVGAFNMLPEGDGIHPPENQEHLAQYPGLREVLTIADNPGLIVANPNINLEVYKRDGPAANINYGLANPQATEHEGVPIEPFVDLTKRLNASTKIALERLTERPYDFGVMVTHATMVEPALIDMINSARSTPLQNAEEIGGAFSMAEFANLTLDQTDGGVYTATLNIKEDQYKVDLGALLG
jgi:hypothetical protein